MPDLLSVLLGSTHYMPHGFCLRWDPALLGVFITGNVGIAIAYFAIPAALYYFVRKRNDLPYPWMFRLFGAFIISCGITHLVKVWTLYEPRYWLEACLDAGTAVISLITAVLLWPLLPKALALPRPAELAKANEDLRRQVDARLEAEASLQHRAKELEEVNVALAEARDEALEASGLKSAFVATISHELRTPLSGILGMNELLLHTDLNAEQLNMAQTVHESARRLLSILNDILDISKIEAGKMDVEFASFSIAEVVNECIQLIKPAIEQKHLTLTTHIDARMPETVFGDSTRIRQVLINLLGNAIKFTEAGSISVRVVIEGEDEHHLTTRFSVTDTGIGISTEERKYLFTPFTQLDRSSTRKYGGTGLGLAISKHLVELMGGHIDVISTKGHGATFFFDLPLELAERKPAKEAASQPPVKIFSSDVQVLVVEDNPTLQRVALSQLMFIGCNARAVADGDAALEELERRNYSLILMDCYLPNKDGYEVTRSIRQSEEGTDKHIPIVAMTAGAMKGDREKCMDAGMDDYLSKPYTIEQLRNIIMCWMPSEAEQSVERAAHENEGE